MTTPVLILPSFTRAGTPRSSPHPRRRPVLILQETNMEDYEAAKLRMQCLELAHSSAIATASGFYSVVADAEKYWVFVQGVPKTVVVPTAPKYDDDIPF
jgi:hypothetical protein